MGKIDKIFEWFPKAELFARSIYKSDNRFKNYLKKVKSKAVHPEVNRSLKIKKDYSLKSLKSTLAGEGIKAGDILIVHSSLDGLARVNANAIDILDMLIDLVGEEGTLVLPSFPQYKKRELKSVPKFDYGRFIAWTGVIPNLFIRERNARVSHLPMNTLSAWGRLANEIFSEEEKAVTTYGKYTPWDFCRRYHAKVLFLGVEPFHSISEAHIIEDLLDLAYPIQDWHEVRTYLVGTKDLFEKRQYRIRKDIWSKYLVEHYHQRKLLNDKMIRNIGNEAVTAYLIEDLSRYVEYMMDNVKQGDLVDFKVPKKFWKTNSNKDQY